MKVFLLIIGCIGECLIWLCVLISLEIVRMFFRLKWLVVNLVCSRVSNWKVLVILVCLLILL